MGIAMRLSATLVFVLPGAGVAQNSEPPPRRSAQLVLTIGGDSDDLATYAFASASSVRATADGRIFVYDEKECHFKVFDAGGKYVRTFGREGAGPGELSCTAMGRWEVVGSTVRVPDAMQGRVVTFSLDGKHISTLVMPSIEGDNAVVRSTVLRHGFTFRGEGSLLVQRATTVWNPYTHLVVRRAQPLSADTIGIIRRDFALVPRAAGRASAAFTGLGHGGAYVVSGDSLIVVVDGYEGIVKCYAITPLGARVQRTMSLGRTGPPLTDADRREMDARIRSDPRVRDQPVQSWSDAPPRWSIATMAFVDGDGAIWVGAPKQEGQAQLWTVFPAAASAFTVELPADFYISFARGDMLYGASTKNDMPIVRVYKLVSPPRSSLLSVRSSAASNEYPSRSGICAPPTESDRR